MSPRGSLVAVCIGRAGELWKTPVDEVTVGEFGLAGDRHAGPTRTSSRRPGEIVPNDRQVSVLAHEVLESVNAELGIALEPGQLGENVLVRGLGDLSGVAPGAQLRIGGVVLRVTAQNEPCSNLMEYHRGLVKAAYKRRGLLATVVSGAGQRLRAGDPVELLAAP